MEQEEGEEKEKEGEEEKGKEEGEEEEEKEDEGEEEGGRGGGGRCGTMGKIGEKKKQRVRDSHDINTRSHGYRTVVSCIHFKLILGCGLIVQRLLERDNPSGLVDREHGCDGGIRATGKGIQHL